MELATNLFTGLPVEFIIPKNTKYVFVADFFHPEIIGGAELTSEAVIRGVGSDSSVLFKLHSSNLTQKLILDNQEKIWVFGNNSMVDLGLLGLFPKLGIRYVFFEYDFKPCTWRSTIKHQLNNKGKPCTCHLEKYGKSHADFMTGAKVLYWCSDKQRDKFYSLFPDYKGKTVNFTQSSTFFPETIENIRRIRNKKIAGEITVENKWAILGSSSWIKGTDDAVNYCTKNNLNYKILQNLDNEAFLTELAKSKGLVFFPRDMDVGSRITTETKLLGGEYIVNENVFHVTEAWFNQSTEQIENYLLDGPQRFWRVLHQNIK